MFILDPEDPILQCPSDLETTTDPGKAVAKVIWSVNASDNSGNVSVSGSHLSGDDFGIGESIVAYVARDQSGNEASCTFAVTVIGENISWKVYRKHHQLCLETPSF